MNLPFKISRRYLFSRKSTNAINVISVVSITGMTIGTAALILVLSGFNGFESIVHKLYGTFYSDMHVVPEVGKTFPIDSAKIEQLSSIDGVDGISLVLEDNAMVEYDGKQDVAILKGVDQNFVNVSGVADSIYEGRYLLRNNGLDYCVVGAGISLRLGVKYGWIDRTMTVSMPKRGIQMSGDPASMLNQMNVIPAGSFLIQQEFDDSYIIAPLDFVQILLEKQGEIGGIEFSMDEQESGRIREEIATIMGPGFIIRSRAEQNADVYKVMRIEKYIVFLVLSFILIIAAFNMIGSIAMIVIEKKRDINILRVLGLKKKNVQRIFLFEGLLQAGISIVLGFTIALIMTFIQTKYGLIPIPGSGTFAVQAYPIELRWPDFLMVGLTIVAIAALASWLPARIAGRVKELRFDR